MTTIFNIILILIGLFVFYELFEQIERKFGIEKKRITFYAIGLFLIAVDIFLHRLGSVFILTGLMILFYITEKASDNVKVNLYKILQSQLTKFDESGWGKVYKADVLRTKLNNLWTIMPEKQKQEIVTWKKSN